jgi:hypothetical protein
MFPHGGNNSLQATGYLPGEKEYKLPKNLVPKRGFFLFNGRLTHTPNMRLKKGLIVR